MIRYCRDRDTERLLAGEPVARFRAFERVARRKLLLLDAAVRLSICAFRRAIAWRH